MKNLIFKTFAVIGCLSLVLMTAPLAKADSVSEYANAGMNYSRSIDGNTLTIQIHGITFTNLDTWFTNVNQSCRMSANASEPDYEMSSEMLIYLSGVNNYYVTPVQNLQEGVTDYTFTINTNDIPADDYFAVSLFIGSVSNSMTDPNYDHTCGSGDTEHDIVDGVYQTLFTIN